jgi:hypothetical protein
MPASLALALILTGCASNSAPTPPAPAVAIPSPPVSAGPELSRTYSPKAQDYSLKVRTYLDKLQSLTTADPPK